MSQQENQHKSAKLKYQNKAVNVRLPTHDATPQLRLDAITRKIKNRFKLDTKQYKLSFNNAFIDLDDPNQLDQIFLNNKPEITFVVTKNVRKFASQSKNCFNFIVIYDENHAMKYPFPLDLEQWNDDMLSNLMSETKDKFQIKTEFLLCEDKKMEFEIDDIEDLKTAVEEGTHDKNKQFNSEFTFDLFIKIEQQSNDNAPDVYINNNDKQLVDNAPDVYINNQNKSPQQQQHIQKHNNNNQSDIYVNNQNKPPQQQQQQHIQKDNNNNPANVYINDEIKINIEEKKIDDNKLMSECFSGKFNDIMQFHQKMFKQIFNPFRCYINKSDIDSELFQNVIDCLNKIKPSEYDQNDYLLTGNIKTKILFWKKYAYLCLMTHNVQKCISLKIAIKPELIETDQFNHDLFTQQYATLVDIINKYHSLREQDKQLKFDNLLIECSKIEIKDVPVDMMPVDDQLDDDDMKKFISSQHGSSVVISPKNQYQRNRKRDNASVRIYLLSPYESTRAYVLLPEITEEWCELKFVSRNNKHLLYLDLCVPMFSFETKIQFKCQTNSTGYITINPRWKLRKNNYVFYWVEDSRSGARKMWDYFSSKIWNAKDEKVRAGQLIFKQLLDGITDFKSFCKSQIILKGLKDRISPRDLDKIWKREIVNMVKQHKVIHVFRMQLIMVLEGYALTTDELYHIIKTFYLDSQISFKKRNYQLKQELGMKIYESFIESVENQFQQRRLKNVDSTNYLLLHSIYHFFKYFENLKYRNQRSKRNRSNIQFHYYHKGNNYFKKDAKWQTMATMDMMKMDLDIAFAFNTKRQYPFEHIALCLAQSQQQNGEELFKNIINTISIRNKQESEMLIQEVFKNSHPQLFEILNNNFNLWMFVITKISSVKMDLIVTNQQVLNSFRMNLKKQINRMSFSNNKLTELHKIIGKMPKIFATVNIHLCLLRNIKLVEMGNNNNKLQMERNLKNILGITLRQQHIDDAVVSELIIFIAIIFQDKYSRNIALSVISKVFLASNNTKLRRIFKEALHKTISQKHNIADRIAMFLECNAFYSDDLVSIYEYFIEIVMQGNGKNINVWSNYQMNNIQNMVIKSTKGRNENAIKIWNGIFDKLIKLPISAKNKQEIKPIIYERKQSMYSDSDMDTDDDDKEDAKDDEIDMYDDSELINNLKYCFSMIKWISFAMEKREIRPLNMLIEFIEIQLKQLNSRIISKEINMECLELLNENNIKKLVQDCEYNRHFNIKKMDEMIKQLLIWNKFSQQFRIFLTKYTKPGDKIELETKTFLQILKNWGAHKYINIEKRQEWNEWIYPNNKKLEVICNLQQSQVFFYIWFSNRDILVNQIWNLDNYLNILYVNCGKQWDNLVQRCHKLQLTFKDKKYFEDVHLMQELHIMKLKDKTAKQIEKDMRDSLKLDRYVTFVQNLIQIVQVFIEFGNTNIEKPNDKHWRQLNENLNTANYKRNDETQNISEAAELYRNINGAVKQQYKDINIQWIKAVVKCKETVKKLANDEEYDRNRFTDTLKIIDDFSTDGQMIQLSGSLRSVYKQFTCIWEQIFNTKLDLMRYFAIIKLKPNDINNLLDVHQNETKIKQIISDAGKMAQQRDMDKLDLAISTGFFEFSQQKVIQKYINQFDESETNVIAANGFKLCFKSDQKSDDILSYDEMNCDEIQNKIDIILLCRRNSDTDTQDEEKKIEFEEEDNDKQNVTEYIKKLEICKEISELRVQYIINGGRMSYNDKLLPAKCDLSHFNDIQNEWKTRLKNWNKYVDEMRYNSHLLNYFTVNKIRIIIEQLNTYKNVKQPLLFEQLLSHFRFIKSELTAKELKQIVQKWKNIDANSKDSLEYFNKCFSNEIILSIYDKKNNKQKNANYNLITNGQPNVMIVKSEKSAIFATLKLYYNSNTIPIPVNQILICNSGTTLEEIEIFIFRCLDNEKRFEYTDSSSIPLYTLLFPEHLNMSISDKAIEIFDKYLLGKNQKTQRYSFVVISCVEINNPICNALGPYKVHDVSSTFTDNDAKNISNILFNGNDDSILQVNKLFVQLYYSERVGTGKSFIIQQKCNVINNNYNNNNLIRIPINSSNINLDFIVDRLYECYGNKRKKIIYHIDISSSASDTINILLFNLLFLRYISTKHSCFSISNKMAFLIELPTNLASLKTKTHKVKDEFYLLHAPIKLTRKHINLNTNPFQYNDNCHYAAKFLQHFHADDLKKNDPDPIHQKVKDNEIQQIMTKFPNEIYLSPIHQYSFWQYLFTQFQQVVHSNLIKNQWYADQDERQLFKHWKHLVTESIIDLAPDFSKKLYNDDQKYDNDDESTGTESFHLTQKWQNQDKPIVLLNQSIDGSISFLVSDINKMDKALKAALDTIKCPLLGWMQQDQNESKQHKIQLLLKILGTSDEMVLFQLLSAKPYCDYALTYDNMLKMIAIFFRIKANIPVILMGETGCGKTCLLNYLAKAANKEIERADVHGGFTYTQIRKKMTKWINKANKKLKQSDEMLQLKLLQYCGDMKQGDDKDRVEYQITKQHEMQQSSDLWIFLDEINTSPDIGYFKEILCDGHFDGKPLPRNMRVIAACNPYRKRKIKHLSKSIINDPLAQYMYRVYPLPSTMKEYVWMFGSLSNRDEKAYCYQMCDTFTKPVLNGRNKQAQQTQLSEAIVISQQFVRKILKDSAFVSLRDIARCLKIFVYSYKRSNNFNESMIESLALVYYFRLKDKQRIRYNKMLSQNGVRRFWSTLEGKNGVIDKICDLFTQVIPKGVALNRSLRENIFLLFICIQTKTPLILVGKPGSSKTLAMSIVKNYLADKAGKEAELLKRLNLSPIHVISFQCSTQSKAVGIKERWKQTEQFAKENKDLIAVLLLDEIGLAEHSQHRPLKILHQLLEIDPAPIAFIGLSNWALDAAKMNRAVMHLCPKHKIADLTKTARAMAKQYLDKKRVNKVDTKLKVLSYVYKDITAPDNKLQPRVDFFGARDFYAVVRHFLMNINQRNNDINQSDDEQLIMYLLRNFGGINYQNNDDSYYQNDIHNSMRDELFKIITKHMAAVKNNTILEDTVDKYPPARLIQLNLTDRRSTHNFEDTLIIDNFIISRHVLVITEHENSWNALIDLNIINHDSIFIFGSEFERDKSNNIYLHLNKVKNCMETGQTLVLCNLEEIHESLYDMLNQRYTLYKHSGKMYCRIALGSNSQSCFVDPQFKVLVIATKKDAHNIASNNAVPIAFLNRFEKQLISYHSSLSTNNLRFLYKLKGEICDRYCLANMIKFKHTFPGFCSDTFASLILNIMNIEQNKVMDDDRKINYDDEDEDDDDYYMDEYKGNNILEKPEIKNEDMMKKCCDMLLDVTLTESLIQSTVNNKNNRRKHFLTEYIPTLQQLIENNNIESTKLLIILTFDFESQLDKDADYFNEIQLKKMSEFSKVDQFEKYLYKYLNGNHGNNNLLLQYRHSDINHFIHIKHTIESKIYRWNKTNRNIILLVHLHRNENLYKEFPLIFCKSAKLVFLDSLSQKQPIRLDSFTNFSIKDVCQQRGIELLQKTFYIALSHLHFSKKINVKNEIKKLDYLLSNNNKDSPIQKLIFDRFLKLLSSNKINRNIGEIVCKSISKNQGWIRGSFYERLNNFIDSIGVIGMIRILQTLYTNYNIDILQTNNVDDNNSVFNLFVLLYSQFDLIEDNNMLDVNIEQILDERPNKLFVKNDYHSSFPFSDKIHFWCNSQKTKIQTLIAQNNEMKNEFEEKQDEKDEIKNDYDMFGDNDNDDIKMDIEWVKLKLNVNQSQIDIADRLRGEMESVWPSFVCELSMNMAELYAKDLILLNGHKLQINQSFPNDIIDLGAKILIIATKYFNNREFDFDQENMNTESKITIAELETMMWNKLEFVKHVIATCNILTTNEMIEISTGNNQSLTLIIDRILENILNSLNAQIYENYNMYSILNSIKYIIHQFDNKNADDIMPLFSKYNMMRIQLIALKNDLIELDINELYQILNNKVSLLDYNTLCESFELLCKSIKTEFPKEKLCNQILYDLLSLMNVNECDEASILGYAQFLIDILCKLDLIIDLENAQTIKWNKNTENEIVRKLFAVLSLETFKSDEIIEQIQNTNKELAGLIIQVMSRDKNDNKICKTIKYAKSQRDFDEKLNIVTPLIEQFNKDIHTQVINAVNIKQFFQYYKFGNKFPILKKLSTQSELFWNLDKLPQIAEWIEMIHSRYMGAISEIGCNKLKMSDVFKQCKLNKYGDQNEWIKLFTQYKNTMNAISNTKLPNTNHNISISSSLMGKSGNKTIQNNLKIMENMINIHNKFFNGHRINVKCNFFDITPNQLINKTQILNIICSNAKPWICYDSKNKLLPKTYLTFNINRIENEIKHQCINGKTRLNIKYQNFECIGSKNMLRLIQSIKINQEILNYEVWHTFDLQFETNMQRKKVLNITEDIIRLLTSSKSNNNNNKNRNKDDNYEIIFEEDSDDDAKDDEKYGIENNNLLTTNINVINDPNIELYKFMRNSLRMNDNKCELFNLKDKKKKIQLKHIQSLWNELVKRIDGEITQYQKQCLICLDLISIVTPIELECCKLKLHYECLLGWIKDGFPGKGRRIVVKKLRCLMCKQQMMHQAANNLFKQTQKLYNKVEQLALQQVKAHNKMNDDAIINKNSEFYNNPIGYGIKLYSFFICYKCEKPHYYGPNRCGDDAENNVPPEQIECEECVKKRMEKLRKENEQAYQQWLGINGTKPCPGNCGMMIQKDGGCNWIQCRCGTQICWQTGKIAGRGGGQCGGGHNCHF